MILNREPIRSSRLIAWAFALALGAAASAQAAAPVEYASELGKVRVSEVAGGLEHPWSMASLPDGAGMLVTERPGRLRLVNAQGELSEPIEGLPEVYAKGQGGLLDLALSPDFASDRLVYLAFAETGANARAGTTVGRGRLGPDLRRLEDFTVIFRQEPQLSTGAHFGVRLVFSDDGLLFIALGDNNQRPAAQALDKLQGKVVRIHPNGDIPADTPFVGRGDARAEIWSYGHRNQQGAALHPETRRLWTHEHGPRGGDEINIPEAGKNYGWPIATHGINYTLLPIPEAKGETVEGTEPPHYVWKESPAISGMAFYTAKRLPAWHGNLFIGALKTRELIRLELDGGQVIHEERLLNEMNARIRDVRQGPDGYLYLLTDASDGKLLKVELLP